MFASFFSRHMSEAHLFDSSNINCSIHLMSQSRGLTHVINVTVMGPDP